VIRDVPYGVTTAQLMDSIVKANDQGKIKIKKVTDNTAKDVEIAIDLAQGISPDLTIDALYAFTDCEVSISPNACVIVDQKPEFISVNDLLKISANQTKEMLRQELEIKLAELNDKWHYTSLEKIFFEEKIYKELEKKHANWEKVLEAIEDAEALIIATEWEEFATLDLGRIRRELKYPIVIDGRNLYDPEVMAAQGFTYYSVGRVASHPDGVPAAVLKNGKKA